MTTSVITGDLVTLFSYIERQTECRVCICAKLPNRDYDGYCVNLLDWKIDGDTVSLRYQMRSDAHAPIFDVQLAVARESHKLLRPNKSKHWKLDPWEDVWRNDMTGQKVCA
jgi:hypothetical protein